MAASVWMKSTKLVGEPGMMSVRPLALTTPTETDRSRPYGLPMTTTQSAMSTSCALPRTRLGSFRSVFSFKRAQSVSESEPTSVAGSSSGHPRGSRRVTVKLSASSTTCAAVST